MDSSETHEQPIRRYKREGGGKRRKDRGLYFECSPIYRRSSGDPNDLAMADEMKFKSCQVIELRILFIEWVHELSLYGTDAKPNPPLDLLKCIIVTIHLQVAE